MTAEQDSTEAPDFAPSRRLPKPHEPLPTRCCKELTVWRKSRTRNLAQPEPWIPAVGSRCFDERTCTGPTKENTPSLVRRNRPPAQIGQCRDIPTTRFLPSYQVQKTKAVVLWMEYCQLVRFEKKPQRAHLPRI